jgi:tetratricopeptide (TPR) repeat protein
MIRLNIYLVYSEELENRQATINSSINLIKEICTEKNIEIKINIISEPSKEYVNKYITSFNSRVNYDKFHYNTIFNDLISPLNVHQISNFEKHRYIYKYILDNFKKSDVNDIHLIMEDDIIILNDYIDNIRNFIDILNTSNNDINNWDILFTCLNITNNPDTFLNINEMYNIIISKSCYIIKNLDLCEKLYNNTNTFKLNIKFTLSKTIKESNFKAVSYNKITFIEGSKLGLYPSSVNPTNYLYLNNNYVMLKQISEKQNLTEDDIKNAEKTYSNSLNIQSVDIQNIMGIIYYNYKNYKKAREYMSMSLTNLKKCKGYTIMKNSEILNNSLNIYKYDQDMLEECKQSKSKYS